MGLFEALRRHPRISVLRGQQGRNDLIEALRSVGGLIKPVAMYEKTQHPQFESRLNITLNQSPVALYFSSTDQPARVLTAAQQTAALLASPVFVSHERIATAARELGFQYTQLHNTTQ